MESASILNCFALAASVQHIFCNSSIFQKVLTRVFLTISLSLSFPKRCITCSVLFGIDQTIDSPGKVPSFENKAAYRIHEDLCVRIRASIVDCPTPVLHHSSVDKHHSSTCRFPLKAFQASTSWNSTCKTSQLVGEEGGRMKPEAPKPELRLDSVWQKTKNPKNVKNWKKLR